MNKKVNKILWAVVIIVVALILVIILTLNPKTPATAPINSDSPSEIIPAENIPSEAVPTAAITNVNTPGGTSTTPIVVTPATSTAPTFETINPPVTTANPAVAAALSSMPGTNEAPKQVVVKAEEIPAAAIKLSVSDSGFTPKEFTIKAGQQVSLAITAVGSSTHVFIFPMASLMGLQTMVSNQETKIITFTAPNVGTYTFRDDIPEFRKNTGAMIVK